MRYALLIYHSEAASAKKSQQEQQGLMKEYDAFTNWVRQNGMLGGEALQATNTATTVRVRNGKAVNADGPFAETKEQLGGFYLINADNLDEAIKVAARIPDAKDGSIEVRPIWELPAQS